jgi:hypothetical protein
MATLKKIRFLKRRMKSVLQDKLDENHAQTLILGLSRRFVGAFRMRLPSPRAGARAIMSYAPAMHKFQS